MIMIMLMLMIMIMIMIMIIAERFEEQQTKYIALRAGVKREYESIGVYQINIVSTFLEVTMNN